MNKLRQLSQEYYRKFIIIRATRNVMRICARHNRYLELIYVRVRENFNRVST